MAPESATAKVTVWDSKKRSKLGDARFAVSVDPSTHAHQKVSVTIADSTVEALFGGDYASRLRWGSVPETEADSSALTPITATRTADATTFELAATQSMVLAATSTASSSNGSGTYAASSLKPASSWDVSAQTGAFSWSYPIAAPPAPAGATPQVSLAYNSQLVDGATSSTNNQPSAVGEGWTLTGGGFIERRYVTCSAEQAPGVAVAGSEDLCWATDNATISFGSRSGTIVRDSTTGGWKLQGDDNSRIEKLAGTAQGCQANGTYNTECWRLTTTDGTQYYFGLNQLPGWSSGKSTTNSVFTTPVFGNDAGDPCHAATFAASSCMQGWRWNLDYVVDVHGNAQAYYYAAETNKYRANDATVTSYVRGGQLTRIDYGLTASTVYAANAATSRIVFGYDAKGRCNPANQASCSNITLGGDATTPTTPSVYPDVPFDLNCTGGTCTSMTSPSFWTTARLATITTQSFTGGSYQTADAYTLSHSFPDPGDGESAALWLDTVTRAATAGPTAITEAPTTFQRTPMQNRVWVVDGLAPLDKFRISSVLLPTGGRVSVNYSAQECTPAMAPTILASPWSNDKRCFPMWWTPDVNYPTQARQDLFHKYIVTSMIQDPYTGGAGSPAITTSYVYTGTPGWRYVDDRLVAPDKRTWSDYAGYDRVEVRVGNPATPSAQQTTQYLFYRGLNGDRADASGGTKTVNVTGTTIPDDRWFGGQTRSAKTLNGVGGASVSETVTTPWASAITANDGVRQARVLGLSRTDTITPTSTGGTRTASTIHTMNARGFVTQTEQSAGTGERVTCTATSYAADNPTAWVIGLPSIVTEYAVPCAQIGTATTAQVLSHKQMAYDAAAVGAAATKGLVTTSSEASGFTGTTLSTAQWVTTGQFTYDTAGRILTSKDAGNRTVTTAYSPAAGAAAGSGPLNKTTVTNPAGWVSSTTVEPYRGLPLTVVDDNGKTATTEYDAMGRLVKAWATDHPKATYPTQPTVTYEYTISTTKPSTIKETTYNTITVVDKYRFIDGLGHDVQLQAPAAGGSGAVITDTAYDDQGRQVATNDQYLAPTVTPGAGLFVPSATSSIPTRSENVYDAAGRITAQVLRSFGTEVRRTTTAYRGSDRVDSTPPAGAVPTSTWMDAWGRKTKQQEWRGTIDGTGVGSTSLRYEYNARDQMTKMTDDAGNVWTWTFDQRGRQTAATDPDAGASSSTFDDLSRLVTRTDARNTTLAYTYDAMNRKTTERSGSVTGTVLASWTYDTLAKGLLTSSSRFDGGLEYKTAVTGYDDGYRPAGSTVTIPSGAPAFGGTTYSTQEYYNTDGTVATTVLPAIAGLPYEELYPTYDSIGRQDSVGTPGGLIATVSYSAANQVTQVQRGGTDVGSALTFAYNAGTRDLQSLDETTQRGTAFTREAFREYTRNAAGIITKAVTTSPSGTAVDTQCFTYGALQELTGVWTPANGDCAGGIGSTLGGPAPYSESFTVDPVTGNRTAGSFKPGATASVQSSTLSYPVAGQPRPHGVTQVQTVTGSQVTTASYGYDASGSTTTYAGTTVAYDESGRLKQVGTGTTAEKSIYTADGQLLLRYGGADGASLFLGDTILRNKAGATTGVRSYMVAGIGFAERVSGAGGGLWWSSPDMVGTVGMQINTAGAGTVTRRWMDPFGQARGAGGAWSSLLGYLNKPASSTGITQLGARAYDPALGRFLTVDPVLDTGEPRHGNGYVYSFNSPVSYSDADGLRPLGAGDYGDPTVSGPPKYTGVAPSSNGGGGGSTPPAAGNGGGDGGGGGGVSPEPEQTRSWLSGTEHRSDGSWCTTNARIGKRCTTATDPDWGQVGGWTALIAGGVILTFGIVCTVVSAGICAPVAGLGGVILEFGGGVVLADGAVTAATTVTISTGSAAIGAGGFALGAGGANILNNTSHGGDVESASSASGGGDDWAEVSGIVRDAANGKGNFGLGPGTASQAERAGQAWVGDGYTIASDGKTWVSSNGLRQWRPPSYKPNLDMWQSNFESRLVPRGQWQSNGHLDITDLP